MIKVLWYSDFLCTTGFGNVAHEIVSRLLKTDRYKFTVVGINHFGMPYNTPGSQFYWARDIPVYPASGRVGDPLGRHKLLDHLATGEHDVLFALQDTFNMAPLGDTLYDLCAKTRTPYVYYFPVDAHLDKTWVDKSVNVADVAVTYTEYGAAEAAKHGGEATVIPHGVNTDVFYPLTAEERLESRKQLHCGPEDFLVVNVNRNQPRKDLARTILAWVKLREQIPTAKLYLHCDAEDRAGMDLARFVHAHVPLELRDNIMWPQLGVFGVPQEEMRRVYGAADAVISTSLGEGWGLATTEAMACKAPVVMPNHTSMPELLGFKGAVSAGEPCGRLVDCNEHFVLPQGDNERLRPVTSLEHLVEQICAVHDEPDKTQAMVERAYQQVAGDDWLSWDRIANEWDELLTKAAG